MNKTLVNGIIIGVVMVIWTVIQYKVAGFSAGILWSILGFAVWAGLLTYFGISLRKANGNVASFGKAFGWLMVMAIVAQAITTIFQIIWVSTMGSSVTNALSDATSTATEGMTTEQQEQIANAMGNMGSGLLITGLIIAFFVALVVIAIINLIIAAIIKRDAPASA